MNLFKAITYLTPVSIVITIICTLLFSLQSQLSTNLALLTFFVFFTSIILSGNLLLIRYANTTKISIKKTIIYISFGLLIFGALVIFNLINFSHLWHVLLGITIIYLLIIQLNILGWAKENHSLLLKLAFSIVLISNLFLAVLFLFKIDLYILRPVIIGTIITSILFLILGVFNTPKAN